MEVIYKDGMAAVIMSEQELVAMVAIVGETSGACPYGSRLYSITSTFPDNVSALFGRVYMEPYDGIKGSPMVVKFKGED